MHVPNEHLPRYRQLVALAGVLECMGNTRSGKGDYAGAHKAWAQEATIRQAANTLRAPGKDEAMMMSAYCDDCGETCTLRGRGWSCPACGHRENGQVHDVAKRQGPVYSDGSPVLR